MSKPHLPKIHIQELENYTGQFGSVILVNGPQHTWERPFLVTLGGGGCGTHFLLWEKPRDDEAALELAVETAYDLGMKGLAVRDPWEAGWFNKDEMLEEWNLKHPGQLFYELDPENQSQVYWDWQDREDNIMSVGDYWTERDCHIVQLTDKDLPVYVSPDDRA